MHDFYNIIGNYIQSDETYAIQIDGDWGIGKTYFIKNNVSNYFLKDNKKFVYFSLYGFDDFTELKRELLFKIITNIEGGKILNRGYKILKFAKRLPWDNIIFSSVGLISDYVLEILQDKKLKGIKDNIIIVIDDLERMNKNISVEDILGFILNELLEKLSLKVLIISNTKEISDKRYSKIKEKVIGRTITFCHDKQTLADIIIQKTTNEFINKNIEWIFEILSVSITDLTEINLRTLFSIIDSFQFVETKLTEQIKKLPSEKQQKIRETIFLNIFVITNEYKLGQISNDNKEELKQYNYNKFFWIYGEPNKDKLADRIIDKYHNKNALFGRSIMYANIINNYVLEGRWEDDGYVQQWDEVFYPEKNSESYQLLTDFRRMTDGEIGALQQQVVCDIQSKEYSYQELISVYTRFVQFKDINLLFIDEEKLDVIENQIVAVIRNGSYDSSMIDSLEENIRFSGINQRAFGNKINGLISDIRSEINLSKNKTLIEAIFEDKLDIIKSIVDYTPSSEITIFKYITEGNYVANDIVCLRSKADLLMKFINRNYLIISNAREFHNEEIPDIKKLKESIEREQLDKTLDRVDNYKIVQLIEKLVELEEHLSI